jgi:4-carboxymuconolactone decarboxylase
LTDANRAGQLFALAAQHPHYEQLILLSALSGLWLSPQLPEAKLILQRYFEQGYSETALRETALQLFLIAGFQASLEAMFQIREVLGRGLSEDRDEMMLRDAASWMKRGRELQSQVYRDNVSKLRANLADISPELEEWTVLVGYGLTLSRPGLPAHWRELQEVIVLTLQGFPRQLHSHFRGALNLGAIREEVEIVLCVADIIAGPPQTASAWQMWRHIKS